MKTETQYYIKKFKLDQENFQFNRQEFIDELSKNFLERIDRYPHKNPKTNCITYRNFKAVVNYYRDLYNDISYFKVGKPLTQGLWCAFYAQTVIPKRKALFPRVQDKIEIYKANTLGNSAIIKHS